METNKNNAYNLLISSVFQKPSFLASKTAVSWRKKRRFLKLLRLFFSIKKVYRSDYQHLSRNAKIKRFSALNDNLPANIGCIRGQNSLFVDFIHSIRKRTKRRLKPDGEMSSTQTM